MIDALGRELDEVGIHGRLRARILAEAADHLAEGGEEAFGDPRPLAREFANGLAIDRSRRAAYASFGALAVAGIAFTVGFLAVAGTAGDITSGRWWTPVGLVLALGTIVFPQVAFVAGGLALLRARRLRGPAAEIALLLARTRVALAFGALAVCSLALFAVDYGSSAWVAAAALAALVPAAVLVRRASAVKSSVPGEAGDAFDDLRLPRHPRPLLAATVALAALALLAAAPNHEGIRNGAAEALFVLAGWFSLGRRLGLRR